MISQLDKRRLELDVSKTGRRLVLLLKKQRAFIILMTIVAVVLVCLYCWIAITFVPPNTTLGGVPIGMRTRRQALQLYSEQASPIRAISIKVNDQGATASASPSPAELNLHQEPESELALFLKEDLTLFARIASFTQKLTSTNIIDVPYLFDSQVTEKIIDELKIESYRPGREPTVTLKTSGSLSSLEIDSGELGSELDSTSSAQLIEQKLTSGQFEIILPVREVGRVLSTEEIDLLHERASLLVGKQLLATAERLQLSLNDQAMIALIDPPASWNNDRIDTVVKEWQKQTGTQPQEPELEYDQTTFEVSRFIPPRNGRTIQISETKEAILSGLEELLLQKDSKVASRELILSETPPTKSLGELNTLGIQERIGFGDSYYAHSIPNRIHNVKITAERVDNTLIAPGSEFSFNKTLGDVSAATGYKSAYVIKNGKTELGDGGGVCQVSTTVFRAALDAGLAITKRLAHSYRVSYYELDRKPGVDATVYAGDVDFRFVNDTPNYILLHTVSDSENTYMYVEFYGTSDGRHTEVVDHKTWDARPAAPTQYYPDPTLPVGKLVQIDWSAPGIRASFTNVIYDKNNQEIRRDTYVSNYKPWSAKYLQGVAP
ncbi:VanW family protein [Candidatus Woesebacteria bacterium]|nr:VanW family protein [Candidatus Woesebacteria bacterium]